MLNPLWLSAWAESSLPDVGVPDIMSLPTPPETAPTTTKSVNRDIRAAMQSPVAPASIIPRLSRISSDCDPEADPLWRSHADRYQTLRDEFERSFADGPPASPRRTRQLSHHGFFRRQILSGEDVFVPCDPAATERVGPSSVGEVLVDKASATIYDAYLLRVDIARGVNSFHRHQVCCQRSQGRVA